VDLMLVPADTFARLLDSAKPAQLEGASVVVPSLEHLLSLKIHALKHGQGLRVLKDMTDVAQLLSVNRVDPRADWVRACSRSTLTWSTMNESSNYSVEGIAPRDGSAGRIVFPDWSGHRPHRWRVSTERWLAYCRANLVRLRERSGFGRERRRQAIDVEFSL
jgi:hypothetical protein